jgi:hypothetical protein
VPDRLDGLAGFGNKGCGRAATALEKGDGK